MRTTRTSTLCLAATILGSGLVSLDVRVSAQDVPEVRPSSEIFGPRDVSAPHSPFSVLEPDWEAAAARPAPVDVQQADGPPRWANIEATSTLVPVQSLQLPELDSPTVDAAAASLVSPAPAASVLPVLSAPEDVEPAELPAYSPRPVTVPLSETPSTASSEDLEGMLHSMVWVTATLGLGAIVSLWMLKVWLTRTGRVASPSKTLKLVDTLRIGPRCGVYLVQAETHRVLVGVEHGKTMCLMPLPASFTESLDDAEGITSEELKPSSGFERVADVFSALRDNDRSKGATS